MSRRTNVIAIVALAAATGIGIGIYRAGLDEGEIPHNDTNIVAPHGGTVSGRRLGGKSWTATYDRLVASGDQTVVDLYGVRDGLIYRKGKPYLRVRAQHLTVNTLTHDFTATGPLRVQTLSNEPTRSFETDSARWTEATQTLALPRPVAVESGANQPLEVSRMSFDVKTGEIDLGAIDGAVRFK